MRKRFFKAVSVDVTVTTDSIASFASAVHTYDGIHCLVLSISGVDAPDLKRMRNALAQHPDHLGLVKAFIERALLMVRFHEYGVIVSR